MLYDSVSRLLVRLQSLSVEMKVLLKCSRGLIQQSGHQYGIGKWRADLLFIPVLNGFPSIEVRFKSETCLVASRSAIFWRRSLHVSNPLESKFCHAINLAESVARFASK